MVSWIAAPARHDKFVLARAQRFATLTTDAV